MLILSVSLQTLTDDPRRESADAATEMIPCDVKRQDLDYIMLSARFRSFTMLIPVHKHMCVYDTYTIYTI